MIIEMGFVSPNPGGVSYSEYYVICRHGVTRRLRDFEAVAKNYNRAIPSGLSFQ